MVKNDIKAIGQRLKEVRKTLRIQQKVVADMLKTSPSYISEIESGKANPGPEFFLKFHNAYKVNMNYIFLGEGRMFLKEQEMPKPVPYNFDEDIDSVEKVLWLKKFCIQHYKKN